MKKIKLYNAVLNSTFVKCPITDTGSKILNILNNLWPFVLFESSQGFISQHPSSKSEID